MLTASIIIAILITIAKSDTDSKRTDVILSYASFSLFIAIGSNLIADLYYSIMPMLHIKRERITERWEALRLSYGEDDLVRAKYALVQTRAWRAMMLVIGLDIIFLGFGQVSIFDYSEMIAHTTPPPAFVLIRVLVAVLQTVIVSLYRMRALTAIGMYIGIKCHDLTFNYMILFLWLGGLFIALLLISGLSQFAIFELVNSRLNSVGASLYEDHYFNLYAILEGIATLFTIFVSVLLYWSPQRRMLRRAIVLAHAQEADI